MFLSVKQKGFDVFNALDLMENKAFLEKLKFGIGDGNLQYYLYNWKCPSMDPDKVGSCFLTKLSANSVFFFFFLDLPFIFYFTVTTQVSSNVKIRR